MLIKRIGANGILFKNAQLVVIYTVKTWEQKTEEQFKK